MKLDKRIGNYTLTEEIGKGNFSTVYLAHLANDPHSKSAKFAIKCISKEVSSQDDWKQSSS